MTVVLIYLITPQHNLRFLLNPCSVQNSQQIQNFVLKQTCLESSILIDGLKSTLNTSQFEALIECVQNARNSNQQVTPPFSLIQGPPGTGKTKVIVRESPLINPFELNRRIDSLSERSSSPSVSNIF
ncbi:MAG: hypothetical protein CMB73_05700 [Euryarchaeota archaeon]|nr:hypothetical protein [Euryarchaeota archaeon]